MDFILKYTICFAISGSKILMIRRNKEPYLHMWNGLGGKIEGEETPKENIIREMHEEADLDLEKAQELSFVGLVTWDSTRKEGVVKGGMYAYLAQFGKESEFVDRETREGLLSWKETDWLCDKNNPEVAENISYFLPHMLERAQPLVYHCTYVFGKLTNFEEKPLPPHLLTQLEK